jgi:hypothetical protein
MDNKDQTPEVQQPQNPTPPSPVAPMGLSHSKVIQPSEALIKEMASRPVSAERVPVPNVSATQTPPPSSPPAEQPPATRVPIDTSSIYPAGDYSHQPSNSGSIGNNKDKAESFTFSNGYAIGGSIFWTQLVAGLVFGLILWGINASVLKTADISVIAIVSMLYYLVEFFVVAYIPYDTLKSNNIEEPFWLTVFGIATQSIIIASVFEIIRVVIINMILNQGGAASLLNLGRSVGGAGIGATIIVVYIGFFIVSYFLTKLSWGITFLLFGKIKSKLIVKAIGLGIIAFIVGGIAYHYVALYRDRNHIQSAISIVSNSSTNTYTNASAGYSLTPPSGWIAGGVAKNAFWISPDGKATFVVDAGSVGSGTTLQLAFKLWTASQTQTNYRQISAVPTNVNGSSGYVINDSWTTSSGQIRDLVLLDLYNSTLYVVGGKTLTADWLTYGTNISNAVNTFRP